MTFTAGSCKSLSHELAQGRAPRRARLPSRQSERGAAAGGARSDRAKRVRPDLPSPMPRGWPASAPRRPTGIFATATSCSPASRSAASSSSRRSLTQAWDDGRPDTVTAFERVGKAYLAFAREEPAFYSAMFESGIPVDLNPTLMAASERAFRDHPRRRRAARRAGAARHAASAGADDGAAHLVDVAWRRVAVRTRRCRAAQAADVAGRSVGSRSADLSARSRFPDRPAACERRGRPEIVKPAARSAGPAGRPLGQAEIKLRK